MICVSSPSGQEENSICSPLTLFYSFTADLQFPHLLLTDTFFLLLEYNTITWLYFLTYNHNLVLPYTEITTRLDFKYLSLGSFLKMANLAF